jgi:nitrate/TMAO reductase-like tetraheme cytochrome c subunit
LEAPIVSLANRVFSSLRDFFWRATRHWISAIGVALSTVAAISFFVILALEVSGWQTGNYLGIFSYLLLPTLLVLGLVLIPVGLRLLRRREQAGEPTVFPVLNFNDPRIRTTALVIVLLTTFNLLIVSVASFKAVQVLDSDAFCGTTCHKALQPEALAHVTSAKGDTAAAHAHVNCVDCHIGEGAAHFVKAKLRGVGELVDYLLGTYPRPLPEPTPVRNAICTRCHAPERFADDVLHIRRKYGEEEKTLEKDTVWLMRVGGFRDGKWQGVHQHNGMKTRYLADEKRTTITEIEVTRADGSIDRFVAKDVKPSPGAKWFEMGCTDCHNRPAHDFSTPQTVVNSALSRGVISKDLPFIAREAGTVLKASYASADEARRGIPAALAASYMKLLPSLDADGKAKVDAAGKVLVAEWTRNNFPDMKISWGTYANYLEHDGCYRCHDEKHGNAKGNVVTQRCSGACHDTIATDEQKPEVLDVLYP